MKKILIGTHNSGKFREIAHLISKKYKKISPVSLKIKSPKETGKTFKANSELKVNFFSQHVDCPVISDDSGLCVKALNNKPGIYSARLAQKHGSFFNAMKFILKKLEKKKDRSATFVCSLSYKTKHGKIITAIGKTKGNISKKRKGEIRKWVDIIVETLMVNFGLQFNQVTMLIILVSRANDLIY